MFCVNGQTSVLKGLGYRREKVNGEWILMNANFHCPNSRTLASIRGFRYFGQSQPNVPAVSSAKITLSNRCLSVTTQLRPPQIDS